MPITKDPSDNWRFYGDFDPYYGVINQPQFHKDRLTAAAKAEFFNSGDKHVEFIFQSLRSNLSSDWQPWRALDFGCGVGRVTLPLAQRCTYVLGLDVSEGMLSEARRNAVEYSLSNVEFALSAAKLEQRDEGFDLVHSFIVFQHIPPSQGLPLMERLLARSLCVGGAAALHFVYARRCFFVRRITYALRIKVPILHKCMNFVQGKDRHEAIMPMYCYDQAKVYSLIQRQNCKILSTHYTDHGGYLGVMLFLQKLPN